MRNISISQLFILLFLGFFLFGDYKNLKQKLISFCKKLISNNRKKGT